MNKIISIHIPKTGGTTFKNLLKNEFENIKVLGTRPLFARCSKERINLIDVNNIKEKVIHGHIIMNQLSYQKTNFYLTWLRDPVERVISHYYYWKNKPDTNIHPIEYRIKYENLSLVDFSNISCMQNIQSYFIGEDIKLFNFVGLIEYYKESIELLGKKLSIDFQYDSNTRHRVNLNKKEVSQIEKRIIMENNKKDLEYYNIVKQQMGS